ncbi:PLP-dependent aminotransferase family protein [Dyella psychrodurans]|uniref:aminotransferase-like domain-containing protein n=1 Tax=Dyella psychrodurans TaxID=1927960 RepID=UPI001F1F5EE9|nr:PLP-dependent aminotransferase family protein [Dyella psychrodurans]
MTRTISIQEAPLELWAAATAGQGPRYLRIVGFIERAIADGRLRPGDRVPPQRQLAGLLDIDLTTVTRAYAEAQARQLIHARGAYGTFVSSPKVELAPIIDLGMNIPPPPGQVDLGELLKQCVGQVLTHTDANALMTYHPSGGSKADRVAGTLWLAPMLGKVDPRLVATCPGAQSALTGLILSLTQPGDGIAVEPLVYPGVLSAAHQLGRHVVTVACDEHGMLPDALIRACREQGAKVIYLNSTLQNPTAHTMPAQRRRDIAMAARECNVHVIEDDPYWRLAHNAPPPIAHSAPERVHYVSTLSKCLAPGLRTAYVVSPDESMQSRFLSALHAITLMAAPLTAAVTTQWMHDGTAFQLLEEVKAESQARLRLAEHLLARRDQTWPTTGIHVWYTLPEPWTARHLMRAARAEGLAVTASDAFSASGEEVRAIRLSLGGARERARLTQGLQKLAAVLERGEEEAGRIVV